MHMKSTWGFSSSSLGPPLIHQSYKLWGGKSRFSGQRTRSFRIANHISLLSPLSCLLGILKRRFAWKYNVLVTNLELNHISLFSSPLEYVTLRRKVEGSNSFHRAHKAGPGMYPITSMVGFVVLCHGNTGFARFHGIRLTKSFLKY